MADRTQLFTVKRIPAKDTGLRIDQWEILGPGAPEKRISVGPVAHMIRDAMEEAGHALLEQERDRVNRLARDVGAFVFESGWDSIDGNHASIECNETIVGQEFLETLEHVHGIETARSGEAEHA